MLSYINYIMKVKFVILSFVKFEFGKMSEISYSSFYD